MNKRMSHVLQESAASSFSLEDSGSKSTQYVT